MRSARSSSIPTTRRGRLSTPAPASRTARAIPRPALVCTSQQTSDNRGRSCRGARHRQRRARPAWGLPRGHRALDWRHRDRSGRSQSHLHRHRRRQARLVFGERRPLHAAGAAQVGLYESTDGGETFSPAVILSAGRRQPGEPDRRRLLPRRRLGCRALPARRAKRRCTRPSSTTGSTAARQTRDGDTAFHQVFGSAGSGSAATLVDLPHGVLAGAERRQPADLRRRLPAADRARFFRVDNANVTAATLFTGGTNGGWTQLSNSTQRHTGLRLVQLLQRAVHLRHAGLLAAGRSEHRLHRRRDAVRRDSAAGRTAGRSSARRTPA